MTTLKITLSILISRHITNAAGKTSSAKASSKKISSEGTWQLSDSIPDL
jgi:hypothetical protein